MTTSRIKVSALLRRWRKAEWPRVAGPHDPLRGEEMRCAEHAAARAEWEDEGGRTLAAPGPNTPL